MSAENHDRAARLIAQDRVEGLSAPQQEWLEGHLENCAECAQMAAATDLAIRSLRAVSVPLPADLANRAKLRVYLRCQDTPERKSVGWVMWTACGASWAAGIASAPYVWRGFEWLGHQTGLPPLVWKMGFALWWAVPALLAAGALLAGRLDGEGNRAR